jgi:hypothetical protein
VKYYVDIVLDNDESVKTHVVYLNVCEWCKDLNNPMTRFIQIGDQIVRKEDVKMIITYTEGKNE